MAKSKRTIKKPAKKGTVSSKKIKKAVTNVRAIRLKEDKKWRAEEDLRTLKNAEEITNDSGRMSAAKRIAREQMAALQKLAK